MSRSFIHPNPIPAKPAFGQFKEPLRIGDYLFNKKVNALFCTNGICNKNNGIRSQSNYLMLKKIKYLKIAGCANIHNSANLNNNLITKLNLTDVPVIGTNNIPITSPVVMVTNNSTPTIYLNYQIDPSGALFGNTPCGLNNYLGYLEPYPPPILEIINI